MPLNRNIGCIEMHFWESPSNWLILLNRNIGCIEIIYQDRRNRLPKS